MKRRTVIITPSAEHDLTETFDFIYKRGPLNAERFLRKLYQAIADLGEFAGYGRARESDFLGIELRQRVFKSYRIVYSIDDDQQKVFVHYVRHGSRLSVGESEGF